MKSIVYYSSQPHHSALCPFLHLSTQRLRGNKGSLRRPSEGSHVKGQRQLCNNWHVLRYDQALTDNLSVCLYTGHQVQDQSINVSTFNQGQAWWTSGVWRGNKHFHSEQQYQFTPQQNVTEQVGPRRMISEAGEKWKLCLMVFLMLVASLGSC